MKDTDAIYQHVTEALSLSRKGFFSFFDPRFPILSVEKSVDITGINLAEDRDIHRKRGKPVSLSLGSKDTLSQV